MSMYALCADVRHFNQCRRCKRNPDRPEHQARLQSAETRRTTNYVRPLTSTTACASQIEAPPVDSEAAA